MKTIALFPGSFNPWHHGHTHTLLEALNLFDEVHVVRLVNPSKTCPIDAQAKDWFPLTEYGELRVHVSSSQDPLFVFASKIEGLTAVVRGLRNTNDFLYEQSMQYWNVELGLKVPTVYLISPPELVHYSSSALREVERITGGLE